MLVDKAELNQLYRYCYALTVHQDDAYDLLQVSIEKYLKHQANKSLLQTTQPGTESRHSEMAYLRGIIRNQFIDDARRANCVPFESLTDSHETATIDIQPLDNLMINEELVDHIWSLLDTSEREIIFLWAIEGYTAKEISSELEVPRGTILSKIHRLRQKVLKKLEAEDPNPDSQVGMSK